jgi:hypothetical protein
MVLGLSLSTFTLLHVIISLAGIGSGLIVMYGLLNGRRLDGWTAIFLTTTALTSLTGYLFPFEGFKPAYVVGGISLIVLAIATWARYSRHLEGGARRTYIFTAALALYFNCFVAVIQAFAKIPAMHALAPTQKEPPFLVAQLVVLAVFLWLAVLASKRFHLESPKLRRTAAGR